MIFRAKDTFEILPGVPVEKGWVVKVNGPTVLATNYIGFYMFIEEPDSPEGARYTRRKISDEQLRAAAPHLGPIKIDLR